MTKKSKYINKWLIPFSWIYGFVMYIRKKLFDLKILKREEFDIPVICVGNLTVGGTGKTPHIEYLVNLLKDKYTVAVLSRGYKRKTKGYILSDNNSTYEQIGDEPFQIKNKFPDVIVAVDEDRRRGIKKLLQLRNKPDVILLDDAFQHLYVKPSYSILLSDFNRPVYEDTLLPAGRLRENIKNMDRANIILVTKCPKDLKPIDVRIISHEFNLFPYQTLLFTRIEYENLISLFNQTDLFNKTEESLEKIRDKKVLLVTGIASPKAIEDEIKEYTSQVDILSFSDHHNFSSDDIRKIEQAYADLKDNNAITIVTEKDAVRLMNRQDLSDRLKRSLHYLPIKISFLNSEEKLTFNKKINNHVRKNSRDGELHKK